MKSLAVLAFQLDFKLLASVAAWLDVLAGKKTSRTFSV